MIQIIEKIEKENPQHKEQLQDIKIDLQEKIPLTNAKKAFLKNAIDELKKEKNTAPKKQTNPQEKFDFAFSDSDNCISTCRKSLESIHSVIKELNGYSDILYEASNVANDDDRIDHIKKTNDILQDKLRNVISNLHMTHSYVLEQINESKSLQTKISIFDNELELKRNRLK